jgi:hypothetical protein
MLSLVHDGVASLLRRRAPRNTVQVKQPQFTVARPVRGARPRAGYDSSRWLPSSAQQSGIPEFHGFANGLRRDLEAVSAALKWHWSNGQTEGHVNRLKTLKRAMYGRAKLDLLRLRLLYAAYSPVSRTRIAQEPILMNRNRPHPGKLRRTATPGDRPRRSRSSCACWWSSICTTGATRRPSISSATAWCCASSVGWGCIRCRITRHSCVGPLAEAAASTQGSFTRGLGKALGQHADQPFGRLSIVRAGQDGTTKVLRWSERVIMSQTGHRSADMVRRYIREGSLFRENAAAIVGL